MFDSANLEHVVDRASYRRQAPRLREDLLDAQYRLGRQKRFPVLVVVGGVEGAGKGETVNLLNEWMDPRFIETHAFAEPSDEERERPRMWRFWRVLPPKGRIGIFFGAWHTQPILDRVFGRISAAKLDADIAEILRFERMLADEGSLILKFWLHLTREQQQARLRMLAKDPRSSWRVSALDWKYFKRYDKFVRVAEYYNRRTSVAEAPWIVVSGADAHYRNLTVGRTLLAALRERLDAKPLVAKGRRHVVSNSPVDSVNVLRALDLTRKLSERDYEKQLEKWQGRLALLCRHPRMRSDTSVIALFEGSDAAGKGGAIRRVTSALDARQYSSVPVAAPTEEERAQPYLWRFWRHVPRRGRIALLDRSWYGRVLVERVEGLCSEKDWMRAYGEINDFEQCLVDHGTVVLKFWLAISKDEQLRRFRQRQRTRFKHFKLTPEDWRNRRRWDAYERAVCDMVDRTSVAAAPWTLVEAEDKHYARIQVLKTLCAAIGARLER